MDIIMMLAKYYKKGEKGGVLGFPFLI